MSLLGHSLEQVKFAYVFILFATQFGHTLKSYPEKKNYLGDCILLSNSLFFVFECEIKSINLFYLEQVIKFVSF